MADFHNSILIVNLRRQLKDLALEVGIKPKDVLRVLVDLRAKGQIKYRFNSDTGEIILGEDVSYTPVANFEAPKKLESALPSEGKNYCVYCGNIAPSVVQSYNYFPIFFLSFFLNIYP